MLMHRHIVSTLFRRATAEAARSTAEVAQGRGGLSVMGDPGTSRCWIVLGNILTGLRLYGGSNYSCFYSQVSPVADGC